MTHSRHRKSKPNASDWRLQTYGLDTQPGSKQDLFYMLKGGEQMKAISQAMEHQPPHTNQQIARQFYRLGQAARTYGVEGMFYNNGISVPIDPSYLPAEARKLGIRNTRQLIEGLAVKHLETPEQMALALSAYEAGATGQKHIIPIPLEFENRRVEHLSEQKAAVTQLRHTAKTLKHMPSVSPQQAAELGYQWGKNASIVGKDRFVHYSKLEEAEDRIAARKFGLDNPVKLAEGAMLSKVEKNQTSPEAFAAFKQAFEQGLNRQPFHQPPVFTGDIATLIDTPSLKAHYAEESERVAKTIEGGLKAVEISGLRADQSPQARAQSMRTAKELVSAYGQAALKISGSADTALPDKYKTKIKDKLQTEAPDTLMKLGILEGAEKELVKRDAALAKKPPLFSASGLLEASLVGGMMNPETALKPAEAAELLAVYRGAAKEKVPVVVESKLSFSSPSVALFSGTLGDLTVPAGTQIATTTQQPAQAASRSSAAPTAKPQASAASPAQQAAFLQTLRELRIINNGINDDYKAERTLKAAGLLHHATTHTIDRATSQALASQGLKVAGDALADGVITAAEAEAMQQVRRAIAASFEGRAPAHAPEGAAPSANVGSSLDQAIQSTRRVLSTSHRR